MNSHYFLVSSSLNFSVSLFLQPRSIKKVTRIKNFQRYLMGVQEKNEGTLSNGSIGASNEKAMKVRKPYTISKQREKWTEEEHQRFLEALKLFGRGWRQIKEHVGTKTAVQIRSHAQKFFSKVVRESSGGGSSSSDESRPINPIEIPPPRPKRKPLHPYPRKAVDSLKPISVVRGELERSSSPNISVAEKQTQSPTSVFTAFSLDDQISAVSSEQHSRGGEEKGMLSLESSSSDRFPEDFLTLKFKHGSACKKVDNNLHTPVKKSIKLFGSTVMVVDDKTPPPRDFEDGDSRNGCRHVQMPPSEHVDVKLSLGLMDNNNGGATTNAWNQDYSVLYVKAIPNIAPQTCWPLYQNVPHFFLAPTNHVMEEISCVDEACSGAPSEDKTESQSSEVECQEPSSSLVGRGNNGNESKKGFVPYKRCLAQMDRSSILIVSDERAGRRARVCL